MRTNESNHPSYCGMVGINRRKIYLSPGASAVRLIGYSTLHFNKVQQTRIETNARA